MANKKDKKNIELTVRQLVEALNLMLSSGILAEESLVRLEGCDCDGALCAIEACVDEAGPYVYLRR